MIEFAPDETEIKANWSDANLYCRFLEADGKNDWRLPTIKELFDIGKVDYNFEVGLRWSDDGNSEAGAWCVRWLPYLDLSCRDAREINYVRAVRDI